jgi:zinc transporter ZupT
MAASLAACGVTTLGILITRRHDTWSRRHSIYFVSFGAGVLLTVSLIHLVPESMQMSARAPVFMLGGFLGLYGLNRFLHLYLDHRGDRSEHAVGLVPMLGIGLHSLIDGGIFAVTFEIGLFTGILTAIGMVLHEFPEGIVTFVLLERGGFSPRKSAIYAFLAAALSTPLGSLIFYPFVHRIGPAAKGALLAMTSGALIYVGATHLLPKVVEARRRYTLFTLAAGVVVGAVVIAVKG